MNSETYLTYGPSPKLDDLDGWRNRGRRVLAEFVRTTLQPKSWYDNTPEDRIRDFRDRLASEFNSRARQPHEHASFEGVTAEAEEALRDLNAYRTRLNGER